MTTNRLNALLVREQYGLTALQIRERGPQVLIPPPYQNWMCPACDTHHMHKELNDHYHCNCGWESDRNKLLRSEI